MLFLEKLERLSKSPAFQQFKLVLKRRLGYPVMKIELDDVQIDLAIFDAIRYYTRNHYDGSENLYIPVKITNEIYSQGYVEFPDSVIGVNKIFDFSNASSSIFSADFFLAADAAWQAFRTEGGMQSYAMSMQYRSLIRDMFQNHIPMRFTYSSGKCYIDASKMKMSMNNWLMFDTLVAIDPEHNHRIYEDPWLTDYAIALIKISWGQVLKKYADVPLPGGIKIDGQSIYQEGKEMKEKMEEEIKSRWQLPPMFIIG